MSVRTGTRIRLLATLLLLAATALSGKAASIVDKNATGCSLYPDSSPSNNGCRPGGDGCYDCLYSNQYGWYECYENLDGSIIGACNPWSPDQDQI